MDFLELIPIPPKTTFNIGLTSPKNADMIAALGHPVKNLQYKPDGSCTQPNVPAFRARIATEQLGPFRATGLKPALASLREIFARVNTEVPELYAILGTEGMLCARFTKTRRPDGGLKIGPGISNHSWGTAIDIKLAGKLDKQGNNLTQRGLLILSAYFNAAGWYWGAAFPTEDAMHFEVSKSLLGRWKKAGEI